MFIIVDSATFPDYANAVAQTLLVFNCKELLKKYYIKENFLKQADHIYLANLADRFITNEHWNYKLPQIPVLQSITFSTYISVQTNLENLNKKTMVTSLPLKQKDFHIKGSVCVTLRNSKLSALDWIQTYYSQFGFLCGNFSLQENDG